MNYTETIRRFCFSRMGQIMDTSYTLKQYFPLVPSQTFLKILKRLQEEKVLHPVSKGVYYIIPADGTATDEAIDQAIFNYYLGKLHGMEKGYTMYNRYGITDYHEDVITAYTSRLPNGKKKRILNYEFTGADILFLPEIVQTISLLEILEKRKSILDLDLIKYTEVRDSLLYGVTDDYIRRILMRIKYQYGTIANLAELLRKKGRETNAEQIYKEIIG